MKNALIRSNAARLTGTAMAACFMIVLSCAPSLVEAPEELPPFSESLVQCTRWMDGSFLQAQTSRDSQAPRMQMNQARIWPERTDGIWLYSELLVLNGKDKRVMHQLIYRAQDDPSGGILIDSYLFPGDPTRFTGAWKDPELFDRVDSFSLKPEAGCAMRLRRLPGGRFKGATLGEDCRTSRGGAQRLEETLTIGSLEILYGLEGFDRNGRTIFGSSKPLVFTRSNATEDPRTIKPGTDTPTDLKMYNMDTPSD